MIKHIFISRFLLPVLLIPMNIYSWGPVGHKSIGCIAENNLSPSTLVKVIKLLDLQSIEDCSTWSDSFKLTHHYASPYHYIDLPIRMNVDVDNMHLYYSTNPRRKSFNVVRQIQIDIVKVKDTHLSTKDRQIALKNIIHFVGDLHQPLHCSDDDDLGGNDKIVRYFDSTVLSKRGREITLHSLWDELISIKSTSNPSILGDSLFRSIPKDSIFDWTDGNVQTWAVESYLISKNIIYSGLSKGPTNFDIQLPYNYHDRMLPICYSQLERAGIRLAFILEQLFRD